VSNPRSPKPRSRAAADRRRWDAAAMLLTRGRYGNWVEPYPAPWIRLRNEHAGWRQVSMRRNPPVQGVRGRSAIRTWTAKTTPMADATINTAAATGAVAREFRDVHHLRMGEQGARHFYAQLLRDVGGRRGHGRSADREPLAVRRLALQRHAHRGPGNRGLGRGGDARAVAGRGGHDRRRPRPDPRQHRNLHDRVSRGSNNKFRGASISSGTPS
jgi:hypothetical protein